MNIVPILIIGIILFISISWTNMRGAPWVPTSMKTVHKMLLLAELKPGEILYDLGCGDGRILVTAARRYQARAVGIELDPLRYLWCQFLISILGLRDRIKVLNADLFKVDLSEADVVTCYLLPDTNKKLEDKLLRELKPGTRVISNTFLFPKVLQAKKEGNARLYIFSAENTFEEKIKKQLLSSQDTLPPSVN
jgi:ribosomal protein L11 methylase PrmA